MTDQPANDSSLPVFGNEPASIVSVSDLLKEARELVIDGEREKAFTVISQALKADMNNPEALYMYAQLNTNKEKSISALKKLMTLQPDHTKGKALLEKLSDVDLFDNKPTSAATKDQNDVLASVLKNQQMILEQQNRQPVIHITNTNTATANAGVAAVAGRNQIAYIIGLLVGIFLGTFGVAHFINGKIGSGIVNLLLGWLIWGPIAFVLITVTGGLGACLVLPIHIALAHSTASKGAATVTMRAI
jgi:TM2 domain-containing membrane protein YozV